MALEIKAGVIETKAARLRRLWRTRGTNLRTSGLALGRPMLAPTDLSAPRRPRHAVTAQELIAMARAARAGSTCPMSQSHIDTFADDRR